MDVYTQLTLETRLRLWGVGWFQQYISCLCVFTELWLWEEFLHLHQKHTHTHTLIPQLWLKTLYCTELSLTLPLLWKLWADLTLIEVSCSWWGAVAWDVLQMYHEWCISNYSEATWNVMMERREATGEKQKKKNTISINLLFSALLQAFAPFYPHELKWVQHWCWVRRSWLAIDDQVWVRVGSLYLVSIPRVCLYSTTQSPQ